MKIATSAEMREIDRITTEKFGVPSFRLMENAGSAVAEFALSAYPSAKSFGVICGKGNNGGDGFVVARKLQEAGKEVRVLLLADGKDLRGDAAENYNKLALRSKFPPFAVFKGWEEQKSAQTVFACDVFIDAILGTGFRPPVSGVYAE